jgi:hypothetical protein
MDMRERARGSKPEDGVGKSGAGEEQNERDKVQQSGRRAEMQDDYRRRQVSGLYWTARNAGHSRDSERGSGAARWVYEANIGQE